MPDDQLKRLFEGLRQENADAHAETRRRIDGSVVEARKHTDDVGTETRRQIEERAAETRPENK